MKAEADVLFETSWEVVNKVGGIYTVIQSKSALIKEQYKEFYLIGPYFQKNAELELEPCPIPDKLKAAFEGMQKQGIPCYFGKWQIPGEPYAILIDFGKMWEEKNTWKKVYWEAFKIDSIASGYDYEEPLCWSTAVGKFIEFASHSYGRKMVVHCHEWMAGFALLYLKYKKVHCGTIFTTHATMLGRALAGSGKDLYSILDTIDPYKEAYASGVQDKFLTEKACAENASVFTTVSGITALEAEKILGRKADVLLLNGLDVGKFPTMEEAAIKHITCREKIREFITYYFFPYYSFNVEHNLIFFIVGRYEYKNKGIDIFIQALAQLNEQLKKENSERTVTAFFWIPTGIQGIKMELLENKNYYRHIKNFVDWNSEDLMKKIVSDIISKKEFTTSNIYTKEFIQAIKRDVKLFKRQGLPPLSTHNVNESTDPIIQAFRYFGLLNRPEDKVKVVFYPVYLTGNDELINLTYYDTMAGCHLGVFPSYYEPWGYTPIEAAALGVPAVTTDLSGCGMFLQSEVKDKTRGIFIQKRLNKSYEDSCKQLSDYFHWFVQLDRAKRVALKADAKSLTELTDWKVFVEYYIQAHNLSLKKSA
ncbi:glycosyltransferase [Candidatus Woesearchaeota archaeon]|nr:hypothetical protein [uncultured archaeon]MBS3142090.1 glycosyltransferase [Candidatus Woesearchaeota archaeon]